MVRCKSDTRFSSIKNKVILTQADTTVGFVSQNHTRLTEIKSRPSSKAFIKIYDSLKTALLDAPRIPKKHKNLVRRAKKTTFIVKNTAFRVDARKKNSQILRDMSWHYSTSANEAGKDFDYKFCYSKADIIIQDKSGLNQLSASKLLKINHLKIRSLR
jgi:tRNA A37 threonylcarbamoyladenosine synthetase subunit TsaC/SUA5/YrdC